MPTATKKPITTKTARARSTKVGAARVVSHKPTVTKSVVKKAPASALSETATQLRAATPTTDYRAVGRRKSAIARVRLVYPGSGVLTINSEQFTKYFPTFDYQYLVLQPLKLLGLEGQVSVTVKVVGGGKFGQAEAVRHGISRCLLLVNEDYRKQLRPAGLLTRDSRVKERKKPGLKKARRAPQFSKR